MKIQSILINIIWMILVIVIITFSVIKTDKFLKLKAQGDCATSTQYSKTNKDTGITVSYPATELYKNCIQQKGY